VVDVDEARHRILERVQPLPAVSLPLDQALFRTLAEDVACDRDDPPFDRSLMDGYAVRAEDVRAAPVVLRVVGAVPAGTWPTIPIGPGETARINTGAPIPRGADAVVRVEETRPRDADHVVIERPVERGHFITPRGAHAKQATIIVRSGMRIGPLEAAALAACGRATVRVHRRPKVAYCVTGDEVVPLDAIPRGAQIRDTNGPLLDACIRAGDAEAVGMGIVRDDPSALRWTIESARSTADMLCLTGGVSMGTLDHVPGVLGELGATMHIKKMRIKPGRPVRFATLPDGWPIFALPGNPVSAFVCFELLVRPALAAMQGRPAWEHRRVRATLRGSIRATADRRAFLPARVHVDVQGDFEAEVMPWGGSGDPLRMVGADALIERPPDSPAAEDGATVTLLLLDHGR
jgi:molybdenum cofactor synthesis domain-containing protein